MNKLEKGHCFAADQETFIILGDVLLYPGEQTAYICQELTGKHRMMVFTAEQISGTISAEQKDSSAVSNRSESPSSRMEPSVPNVSSEKLQELMIRFLEASSCGEKLEVLELLKGKATETMLDSMAISMDFEVGGGCAEEKYYALERFLKIRARYEGKRLR